MKVALTGAGGFIGSTTQTALRDAGLDVRAHLGPQQFDIGDRDAVRRFVRGSDVVVHLAGPPSVAESFARPRDFERAHVLGTATVLEAMEEMGVRRIVYLSSADVYGSVDDAAVNEERPLNPGSPYAVAKTFAEGLIARASLRRQITAYVIRPFSVYGPGMHENSLIATICRQAAKSDDIYVNDLMPVRDYCLVGDLADLLVRAVLKDSPTHVVLNAAYGKAYSVAAVIDAVGAAYGRRLVGRERGPKRPRDAEIRRLVADITRARTLLGWRARYDLVEGIRRSSFLSVPS